MAKCWKCGKSGLFLSVGQSGLCVDCLEKAADGAIKLISMLKSGERQRKEALEILDNEVAREMAEKAAGAIVRSKFNRWAADVHANAAQLERVRRSASVKILEYDSANEVALVKGSGKEPYKTSFSSCDCGDFSIRHLPCKHMYRVAAEFGGIDFLKFIE